MAPPSKSWNDLISNGWIRDPGDPKAYIRPTGKRVSRKMIFLTSGSPKKEWKNLMRKKIESANRSRLIEEAKKYKKIDYVSLSCEEYKIKDYFCNLDLAKARLKFRERAKCMRTCKRHYSSDPNNLKTMFFCQSCDTKSVDVLSHWRVCESYDHLRINRNFDSDFDLVSYYQDVIDLRRAEME